MQIDPAEQRVALQKDAIYGFFVQIKLGIPQPKIFIDFKAILNVTQGTLIGKRGGDGRF